MSNIFDGKNVIVQGITGSHGSFQTKAMLDAGTRIVGGVTPGKEGQVVEGVPVYNTVKSIQEEIDIDTTIIFVPAPYAKSAILEAIEAKIPLIVIVTEGIPIHDMLYIHTKLKDSSSTLLGPNSPGALLPGVNKLGIIPAAMSLPGKVAIVSRSGTLTYETMSELSSVSIGQKYVIGIGGDQIHGMGYVDCLKLFESDPDVSLIALIGEIGGQEEIDAAKYIKEHIKKPVVGYIAGHHAPAGVQLGHAGAILGSEQESAEEKTKILESMGVRMSKSITDLVSIIRGE